MISKIKKPVSILLSVIMVFSLFTIVPFTASAAENGLYVNNVYANTTTSGAGWSFDTQTNTLTLEDYSFTGVGSAPPNDSTVIMYYPQNGTLTIDLKGTNTIVQGNGTNRTWWGIYCRSDLVITGDGTLNISTTDGGYRGAAIYGEKNITITGNCTVNAASGTVTNGPQGHGICHSDNAVLAVGENANVTSTGPNDNTVIAASVTSGGTTMRYTFADAVNAWNSAANGSTLTLLADVTISSTIGVSGTKTLDLNGHGIRGTGKIEAKGNCTLIDSNPTTVHYFDVENGLAVNINDTEGEKSFTGGYLTGGTNDWGSAIHVHDNSQMTMNGGTIIGNTSNQSGAVRVDNNCTFTMTGGQIIYNRSATGDQNSASLNAEANGKIQFSGNPVIKNNVNSAGNPANAIIRSNLATKYKVIGTLTDGAEIGITIQNGTGIFTASDDTSFNDASKFFSDDSSYTVGKNADGQLVLGNLFTGQTITLNGYIDLNFYLNPDIVSAGKTVSFTWNNGTKDCSAAAAATELVAGKGYKATVRVPAAEMTCPITASVEGFTTTKTYSVRDYCDVLLSDAYKSSYTGTGAQSYENLEKLVKAMLDYGAKAQLAFGVTNVRLANDGITYSVPSKTKTELIGLADEAIVTANGSVTDTDLNAVAAQFSADYYTSSLIFLSGNTLRHYFTPKGTSLNASNFDGVKSDWYYYVQVPEIKAAELDNWQTFRVGSVEFKYAALDFVKDMLNKNAEGSVGYNLAEATYWYNDAANKYFVN